MLSQEQEGTNFSVELPFDHRSGQADKVSRHHSTQHASIMNVPSFSDITGNFCSGNQLLPVSIAEKIAVR